MGQISRRGFIVGGAAVAGTSAIVACTPNEFSTHSSTTPSPFDSSIAFDGFHQPGIQGAAPLLTSFLGLDLRSGTREQLEAILRLVSDDARRLMAGRPALADTEPENAAQPANLTIGIGLGRSAFAVLGLEPPDALSSVPAFSGDALEDRWGQTDIVVQVGSDNPLALAHAVRMVEKDVATLATTRWAQEGFRGTPAGQVGAMRNLMGQVDGTVNPRTEAELDSVVWIDAGPPWLVGGTVLVLRRIRMKLDAWDSLESRAKELVTGRRISDGAPLSGQQETDPVDLTVVDNVGLPVIPIGSHVAVAHSGGEQMLRRPFNYVLREGTTADSGMIFAAYMRDPATSFIPLQERLASLDTMSRWVEPIGSAAYAFPRGCRPDGFVGQDLFI